MTTRLSAAVLGFVFVPAIFVGNTLTELEGAPDVGAEGREYAQWLSASPPGTVFWAGAYVELLGLLGMLAFFVAFSSLLRASAPALDWLPTLALGAGLVSVAVKLASGPVAAAVYDRAPEAIEGDTAAALLEANDWSFVLTFAIDGVFLLAAGAVIVTTRLLPRWLGWTAIALGALNILAPLGGLDAPPAILLFLLWVLVASALLLRRASAAPRPAAQ